MNPPNCCHCDSLRSIGSRLFAVVVVVACTILAPHAGAFQIEKRIISGAGQGWKSYGDWGGTPPPANWMDASFDDQGWSNVRSPYPNPNPPAAFISPAYCGPSCNPLQAQFMWHDPDRTSDGTSGVPDAYFRNSFYLSVQADSLPLEAIARIQVDDDFEFFVNGHSVFLDDNMGHADQVFSIDFTQYLLHNAINVLAIHAVDGEWGNPWNRIYEDVLFDARIRSVDEPEIAILAAIALLGVSMTRRPSR